jgi:hypothetical protein
MTPQELNEAWLRLEGVRQSYLFPSVPIQDMDGSSTLIDRLINKYEQQWDNYFTDENHFPISDMPKYEGQYAFVNKALQTLISDSRTINKARDIAVTQPIIVTGRVVRRKPKPKKAITNYLPIVVALIAIVGTIGILKSKKGMRAFTRV